MMRSDSLEGRYIVLLGNDPFQLLFVASSSINLQKQIECELNELDLHKQFSSTTCLPMERLDMLDCVKTAQCLQQSSNNNSDLTSFCVSP